MVGKPLVIDIYQGDNVHDQPGHPLAGFDDTKRFGIIGCIHKASEGLTLADRRYASRRKAWMAGGDLTFTRSDGTHGHTAPLWGAYHFFHGSNAKAEADHFLSVADVDKDTLVCLDWEAVGASGYQPPASSARAFLDRIKEKLGRKAVIYSGNVAKEQLHGNDAYFGAHRLWLASYGSTWKVQASWDYPWLWQDDGDNSGPGPHRIPGIDGYCDNSTIVAPMTVERLVQEWAS